MNNIHRFIKTSALLLVVLCMVLGLAGCGFHGHIIGISDYRYDNAENYTVGNAELTDTVESIEINWMVGKVTVLAHDENVVAVTETSDDELAENKKLRYWLDGTTLRIQFCACGKWDFSGMDKDLTVLVPSTLNIANLELSTISADVNLTGCAVTQSLKIETVSGNLNADLIAPLQEFEGDFTSGEMYLKAPSIVNLDANMVSGAVSLTVQKEPDYLSVDSTSGNVYLNLPENASFTLDYDEVSGDIYTNLSYRRVGGKYVFGDGSGDYTIDAVSGDVRITKNTVEE